MRKILAVAALALLAACGSSKSGVSVSTAGDNGGAAASTPAGGTSAGDSGGATETSTDDTISVDNLGDMPKECIALFSDFLKQIEPLVKDKDWSKATLNDLEALGTDFEKVSTDFDTNSAAKGCDKYDISGSDDQTFQQMIALAKAQAPGTVPFLEYLYSFTKGIGNSGSVPSSGDSGSADLPKDCQGTIDALEPIIAGGKTMQEMTLEEITKASSLLAQVAALCPPDTAAEFYQRPDVVAFYGAS